MRAFIALLVTGMLLFPVAHVIFVFMGWAGLVLSAAFVFFILHTLFKGVPHADRRIR